MFSLVNSPAHLEAQSTPSSGILQTAFSLWKRVKCFPSKLTGKFENTTINVYFFDLCLKENSRSAKSRDYRDVIVFEKLRFRDGLA